MRVQSGSRCLFAKTVCLMTKNQVLPNHCMQPMSKFTSTCTNVDRANALTQTEDFSHSVASAPTPSRESKVRSAACRRIKRAIHSWPLLLVVSCGAVHDIEEETVIIPEAAPLPEKSVAPEPAVAPQSAGDLEPAVSPDSIDAPDPSPISLEGWPSETFALPPGFAPELPAGSESLLFAPGWRDSTSEDFWSYAFVMQIDEPVPNAPRVEELLELYYAGLMTAFARGDFVDTIGDSVNVELVSGRPNHFEAEMHLIDAFSTFEPIGLRVLIDTFPDTNERSSVHIRVSAQPKEHEIWRSLEAAIASILAADGPTEVEEE